MTMPLIPCSGPLEDEDALDDQIAFGEFLQAQDRRFGRPVDLDIARKLEDARARRGERVLNRT